MVRFFLGHIVPGSLFLLLSLRWSIATAYEYSLWRANRHHKRHRKELDYRSSVTMNLPCNLLFLRNKLVESYLKLIGAIYGVCFHFFEATDEKTKAIEGVIEEKGEFGDTWSIMYRAKHHYAIYGIFMISSAVELLMYYGVQLPEKLDRALFILSFGVEAFMFSFHFHGRGNIDVQLHVLQTVSIYMCLLFSILEAVNERQVLYTYGRCLFTGLQGSWFFQTAFTLYYPYSWPPFRWDLHDHKLIANVTFQFCAHFMGFLVSMIFLHLLIQWIVTGSPTGKCEGAGGRGDKRRIQFVECESGDYKVMNQWSSGDDDDFIERDTLIEPKIGENTYSDFVNHKEETFLRE